MEQKPSNLFDLHIDPQSQGYLSETAKWAKFLSILGFIMLGLFVILMLVGGASTFTTFQGMGMDDESTAFGAVGIVVLNGYLLRLYKV